MKVVVTGITGKIGRLVAAILQERDHQVVGIDARLAPWRFGRFYKRVRYVVELPAGAAEETGTAVGDLLETHRVTPS